MKSEVFVEILWENILIYFQIFFRQNFKILPQNSWFYKSLAGKLKGKFSQNKKMGWSGL